MYIDIETVKAMAALITALGLALGFFGGELLTMARKAAGKRQTKTNIEEEDEI